MSKNFYHQIKKFLSRRLARDKAKWEPNPRRDWRRGIVFFFAGLLLAFASFAFLQAHLIGFKEDKNLPVNLMSSEEKRNLDIILTEFKNKAKKFKNLETKPSLVDPSL